MHRTLVIACSIAIAISTPAFGAKTAKQDNLEQTLQAAKILPAKYSFRVIERGNEVWVQTHLNASSSDPDRDAKIDAVLIGKLVTEKRPNVAKVRVQFYDADNSSYRQVTVSVSDIAAFALGGVSKDKLLESLDVVRASTGELSAKDRAAFTTFSKDGLTLSYPKDWSFTPKADNGYLGEFNIRGLNDWASIQARKQKAAAPAEQAGYDESFMTKQGWKVVRKNTVSIGPKRLPGYELLLENDARLQQHLYFGSSGNIFSLNLMCDRRDSTQAAAMFAKVLSTVNSAN